MHVCIFVNTMENLLFTLGSWAPIKTLLRREGLNDICKQLIKRCAMLSISIVVLIFRSFKFQYNQHEIFECFRYMVLSSKLQIWALENGFFFFWVNVLGKSCDRNLCRQ